MQTQFRVPVIITFIISVFFPAVSTGCKKSEPKDNITLQAISKPFLWRIDGKKPSYLFGTIHIPDERVTNLPGVVSDALDSSDAVFTEIPMDISNQLQMTSLLLLPDNKTLNDILPAELYSKIEAYFKSKGVPLKPLSHLKIWALASQLTLLEHWKEFAMKKPQDACIYTKAKQAGKQLGALETIEEQVAIFDELTLEEQICMLTQTLDLIEKYERENRNPIEELTLAYISGDDKVLQAILDETYDPTNSLDQKLMQRLLTERNVSMATRIEKELANLPENGYFFAVGASHLPGDKGIVKLLQTKGMKITRIKSN